VHNVDNALQYAQLLNQFGLPNYSQFEVIEVTDGNAPPKVGSQLLGFDLSADLNNSLLWWQFEPQPEVSALPPPIQEEVNSICKTYRPQLNSSGLFQTAETASKCLKAMDAVQGTCPFIYEAGELRQAYRVVGIYVLRSRPNPQADGTGIGGQTGRFPTF